MKNDKISIICGGVTADMRPLTDILLFTAERAEFVCRSILEHLCSHGDVDRSHLALEADRNLAAIEVLRKDKVCRGLLPDYVAKALDDASHELAGAIENYFDCYPQDDATRMLTSGTRPTLRGYINTALERWSDNEQA